ncbi:MAG: class I SAM-dependent methyltransferase [Proteobacteria bacterium]|nr:class I SAM-dependent methyltransferase [Pseudomonadota bacterium]
MADSFKAKVLNKYDALYKVCGTCGFLSADKPHWLDEAYARAIADADTGLVMRNLSLAPQMASTLYWAMGERGAGRYLDTAGGYGMLTRLMRDFGFDFYWYDEQCKNILAPGFSFRHESKPCRAVTAVEVFEHLTDPRGFVEKTLAMAGSDTLIFTTLLYDGAPPPASWWYYSFATGQHIGFFQRRTLERLAAGLNMQFASANGIHVFSKAKIHGAALQFATRRAVAFGTVWWIRKKLGSKTMADHELLLRRNS